MPYGDIMADVSCMMTIAFLDQPLRVPATVISLLWALPICLSIALIYKAIKVVDFNPLLFLREVALLFATIVGFLVTVAVVLLGVTRLAGI